MRFFVFLLICSLIPSVFADDGYIGEDLGTDIYRRVDTGNFKLKQQMVDKHLKGSAEIVNKRVGKICSKKSGGNPDYCFLEGSDFTATELDSLMSGEIGPVVLHLKSEYRGQSTDSLTRLTQTLQGFYQDVRNEVDYSQEKLQSVGSIGLFTDGSIDNSSYDLMYDLEQIHSIIFAKDIPYNGTENMGMSSISNLLNDRYKNKNPLVSPLIPGFPDSDQGGSGALVGTGADSFSGLLTGSTSLDCPPTSSLPTGLDSGISRDIASQMTLGSNARTSFALIDNGFLPEHWAQIGKNMNGSIPPSGDSLYDTFPCSGTDFFCITVEVIMYAQNILAGWKANTIEKILDENLKIANKFAGSSFVQSNMTHAFFQCDVCKNFDLPSMAHIGTVVTRIPPPILNLKPARGEEKEKKDELQEILVNTFESVGIDYKRQNSIETDKTDLAVANSTHLTTDVFPKKLAIDTPARDGYIRTKEVMLKKSYYDSFNDDLIELQGFTTAFSKSLLSLTSIIQWMYDIPQK